jgi:regulator of protease activity HflC (stomatin/prohibitin superfamily)
VPSGQVGVKVYLLGGNRGVDHEVLGVGRYYIGYNEQLFLFPTFQQNYVWTSSTTEGKNSDDESIEFGANQGVDVHSNVGVSFHIDIEKVADVFQKYRKGVDEIRDIPLRNAVRNAFNKRGAGFTVEDLYTTKKADLLAQVLKDVREQFTPIGVVVDDLSFVGNFKLPDAVTQSLNAKIQATQDADRFANEVAGAQSKKQKAIIEAEATAIANSKKAASLTPALIEWERIQKWDGHLPQVQGSGTPFISLNK